MIRKIHKIDATEKIAGRLASQIALLLRGKNKPEFQPHKDEGDIVEVSNVALMKFTGKKLIQKMKYNFSGYHGGLKSKSWGEIKEKNSDRILRMAVKNMLPNNRLRPAMLKRLIIR